MDWTQIIVCFIGTILGSSSILYLIVNKRLNKKEDEEKVTQMSIETHKGAMDIYESIEEAVEKRVIKEMAPYKERIESLENKNTRLEARVIMLEKENDENGCYRSGCEMRIPRCMINQNKKENHGQTEGIGA